MHCETQRPTLTPTTPPPLGHDAYNLTRWMHNSVEYIALFEQFRFMRNDFMSSDDCLRRRLVILEKFCDKKHDEQRVLDVRGYVCLDVN